MRRLTLAVILRVTFGLGEKGREFKESAALSDTIAAYLESIVATAGSVLFMKINVVHASSINMSPMRRLTLYLNVCPVDNHPDPNVRPKYVDILSALSLSVL